MIWELLWSILRKGQTASLALPIELNLIPFRAVERDEHVEEGKKKKGGVTVPEYWPWEEAKKVFQKPDVMPADEIEVGHLISNSFIDRHEGPISQCGKSVRVENP